MSTLSLGIKEKIFNLIVSNSTKSSFLFFFAAIAFLISWPFQAKSTYFSENAISFGMSEENFYFHPSSLDLNSLGIEMYNVSNSIYAKIRSPRGNGKESILIGVKNNPKSMNLIATFAKYISKEKWLHHDVIIFMYKEGDSYDYTYLSSGIIREAIIVDLDNFNFNELIISTEGYNGQLPNLDLVNIVIKSALRLGIKVSLYQNGFKIHHEYDTLINHFYNQLIGLPTGIHAEFRKFNTHSLTIKGVGNNGHEFNNMNSIGQILTITTRCLNNLIEGLHQSYFIYFMISPLQFMGFEEFLPNLALFILPFLLKVNWNQLTFEKEIYVVMYVYLSNF